MLYRYIRMIRHKEARMTPLVHLQLIDSTAPQTNTSAYHLF